jgi:hypothetical protein
MNGRLRYRRKNLNQAAAQGGKKKFKYCSKTRIMTVIPHERLHPH